MGGVGRGGVVGGETPLGSNGLAGEFRSVVKASSYAK